MLNNKTLFLLCLCFSLIYACKSDGPRTTDNGYEYILHKEGNGQKAQKGDFVYFEMQIKKEDGTVLQDMTNLPNMPVAQIPEDGIPNKAINPVIDILGVSSVGDSISLFIPIDSIPKPPADVQADQHVIYQINIRDLKDKAAYEAQVAEDAKAKQKEMEAMKVVGEEVGTFVAGVLADYKAGKLSDKLQKLDSGLEYIIHEEGNGPLPKPGQNIVAHYYGIMKSDGNMFDNSYRSGRTFSFPLGKGSVIKGWDQGFAALKVGTKATLFIPYDLAYGEAGRPPIGPKSDLVFHVDFKEIK